MPPLGNECATLAKLSLELKDQYQALLGACTASGIDKRTTKIMDTLGLLIKQFEHKVVILEITLDQQRDAGTTRDSAATAAAT